MPYNFPKNITDYVKAHPQKPKKPNIPLALCKSKKPTFRDLWERAEEVYDIKPKCKDGEVENCGSMQGTDSLDLAGLRIGGLVKHNLTTVNPKAKREGERNFPNACATRMSYILQYNGISVPRRGFGDTVSGSDKLWYLFRVEDIKKFIPHIWKEPTLILSNLHNGEEIKGKTGLLIFDVGNWSNATGHVTLWDGERCYDDCEFQDDLIERGSSGVVTKIYFWEIK